MSNLDWNYLMAGHEDYWNKKLGKYVPCDCMACEKRYGWTPTIRNARTVKSLGRVRMTDVASHVAKQCCSVCINCGKGRKAY